MMLVLLDVDRFGEEELGLLGGFLESGINKVSKSLGTVFFYNEWFGMWRTFQGIISGCCSI